MSVSVETVKRVVCSHYRVSKAALHSRRRRADLVRARHIAIFLAYELTDFSTPELGRRFGQRDHTTILNAFHKIRKLRKSDSKLAAEIAELRVRIEASTDFKAIDNLPDTSEAETRIAKRAARIAADRIVRRYRKTFDKLVEREASRITRGSVRLEEALAGLAAAADEVERATFTPAEKQAHQKMAERARSVAHEYRRVARVQ